MRLAVMKPEASHEMRLAVRLLCNRVLSVFYSVSVYIRRAFVFPAVVSHAEGNYSPAQIQGKSWKPREKTIPK